MSLAENVIHMLFEKNTVSKSLTTTTKIKHVEKVLKHKDLEAQLADAKFQQSELKLNEMIERSKKEKEIVNIFFLFIKNWIH